MAIPSAQLKLIITNTYLTLIRERPAIRSSYQVIAPNYDAEIAEIAYDQYVNRFDAFEDGDSVTFGKALAWFSAVKEWHKSQSSLDNYSYHDTSLCLYCWTFYKPNSTWTISHPVCGEFAGLSIPTQGNRPTLQGRVTAVLDNVAPPPVWSWAESNSAGVLTVHCVAVPSADSYNVYNDLGGGSFTLLGNVPDHTSNNLSVSAGTYRVRMAAVISSQVGVMGNDNLVMVA